MKKQLPPFIFVAALFFTLGCVTLMGTPAPTVEEAPTQLPAMPEEPPIAEPTLEETAAFCPAISAEVMRAAFDENFEENLRDEETYLVTYLVDGDEIMEPYYEDVANDLLDEQEDAQTHQQVWDNFAALIPAAQRVALAEYSITTDGKGGTLAAVTQTTSDPSLWALEVDIADAAETYSLTYTLAHEFGHLLTLGPDQVPPSVAVFNNPDDENIYLEEVSRCPQYFPGEGCAQPDSYINAFYESFWADIHEEWQQINLEEDEDLYYEKLDEFYAKYQDQFVSDYAATNPEEDMAETWAFFVFTSQPAGDTIAEEKVLFFYQYPELVALRAEILGNACALLAE